MTTLPCWLLVTRWPLPPRAWQGPGVVPGRAPEPSQAAHGLGRAMVTLSSPPDATVARVIVRDLDIGTTGARRLPDEHLPIRRDGDVAGERRATQADPVGARDYHRAATTQHDAAEFEVRIDADDSHALNSLLAAIPFPCLTPGGPLRFTTPEVPVCVWLRRFRGEDVAGPVPHQEVVYFAGDPLELRPLLDGQGGLVRRLAQLLHPQPPMAVHTDRHGRGLAIVLRPRVAHHAHRRETPATGGRAHGPNGP